MTACDDVDALTRCHDHACDAAVECANNAITNAGFEAGTAGWFGYGGQLTSATEGHTGNHAAEACKTSGAMTYYTIGLDPPPIAQPMMSATFEFSAWVRRSGDVPQVVGPVIRENGATAIVADSGANHIDLTADWQRVHASYRVQRADSVSLDVYIESVDAPANACLDLDDACLQQIE